MYPFTLLPPALGREMFAELCRLLPPPAEETRAAIDARDTIAMTAITTLEPADTVEAMLAVQVVATEAHARDCLGLAMENRADVATAIRCGNQAALMMRQMERALRSLERRQSRRPPVRLPTAVAVAPALEPVPDPVAYPGRDPVAYPVPDPGREIAPEPAPEPPPPVTEPTPPTPAAAADPADPAPDGAEQATLAKAEHFMSLHPELLARLRLKLDTPEQAFARLDPDEVPTDPAFVQALIEGDTPLLRNFDRLTREWGVLR